MIRDVMAYSGIVTKVRGMRAKLLKPEDYKAIAAMQTVTDMIQYLRATPAYGALIEQMDESLYHRGNIEKILVQSLYDDYTRLYRFANAWQRKFLKLFMKRYEADLIKYCFRIVFNHYSTPFDLNYKKDFFDRYSDIRIDRLITSRNIEELVEHLKNTEYYVPLKRIQESGAKELSDYDIGLELYYFSTLWKMRKKIVHKADREMLTKDVGTQIDFLNLQWIYRTKKYYHMLPPDIYTILIPIHYRFRREEMKALVEAPSVGEFKRILSGTFYGKKYQLNEGAATDRISRQCLRHIFTAAFRNHPYSLASLQGYLFLKEEEIYQITTVLECIRYGLPERETLKYIQMGGGIT